MQKRQHDKRMQTKLVSQHAFHIDASDARDGEEKKNGGCKIKYGAHRTIGWTVHGKKKFGGKHREQHQTAEGHRHLAHLSGISQVREEPVVARRFEYGEIIGLDVPAELLR